MKIAVMGAGGVGGYFGGRLAQAGLDVVFIARGAHLDAIRARGLAVRSPLGDFTVDGARAESDPAVVGPVDVVLFATKLYDVEPAATLCQPLVGAETVVVSLLNGVDSEERLSAVLGAEHVAGGVARISAEIEAPGVIRHNATFASLAFGEMSGRSSTRLDAFREAAAGAEIDARIARDIESEIWQKFIMLAGFSAITALTRLPIGPIRSTPATWALLEHAVSEVTAVARAKGIRLPGDATEKVLGHMQTFPDNVRASMAGDLERGRRLELEWLSGAVVRLGHALGVPTPVHDVVLAALLPFAAGAAAVDGASR